MPDEVKAAIERAAIMAEGSLRLWLAALWLRRLAKEDLVTRKIASHGMTVSEWRGLGFYDQRKRSAAVRAAILALARECEK